MLDVFGGDFAGVAIGVLFDEVVAVNVRSTAGSLLECVHDAWGAILVDLVEGEEGPVDGWADFVWSLLVSDISDSSRGSTSLMLTLLQEVNITLQPIPLIIRVLEESHTRQVAGVESHIEERSLSSLLTVEST